MVDVMPNATLPLVRRSCVVHWCVDFSKIRSAARLTAFCTLVLIICCLVCLICYVINYKKILFLHKYLISLPFKMVGKTKFSSSDLNSAHSNFAAATYLEEEKKLCFCCIVL